MRADDPIALGIEEELKGDGGVGVFVLALRFWRLSNHVRTRPMTNAGSKRVIVHTRTRRVKVTWEEDDAD